MTPSLGKLANICAETDSAKLPASRIKAYIAGDEMNFERKGLPHINAKPTARIVAATNNRPQIADRSDGLWSRIEIIPFLETIPAEKRDRSLPQKLKWELSGILNWALVGRRRLYAQNGFTDARISREWLQQYREASAPEKEFLSETCEPHPTGFVAKEHLYYLYSQWASAQGYKPLNIGELTQELRRTFRNVAESRPSINGQRVRGFTGIKLSPAGAAVTSDAA